MSINDEWVRYLRAEGYLGNISDMLRTALQAEAASSYKNLNDLWVAYLNAEGYTGNINDMMYQWLGDKGYTGNLNDRLLAALKADDIFAADAIACVITLTTAYAASFGLQPATISGQTFSITGGTNGVGYLASTDVAVPTPAWTGKRIIELGSFSNNGAANIRGGIVLPDGSKGIFFEMLSSGQLEFSLEQPVGTPIDVTSIDELSSSVYAVGVDMPSGDVYIYIDGVANGGIGPYAGFFSGATGFSLLGLIESATSGNASMTFVTDGSLFTTTYTDTTLRDWCGNDAVPKFDPASLYSVSDAGDYWDFTDTTTLYEDVGLLTPTTVGNPIGAVVGKRGLITLTQGTTAAKPTLINPTGIRPGAEMNTGLTRRSLQALGVGSNFVNNWSIGFSSNVTRASTFDACIEVYSTTANRSIGSTTGNGGFGTVVGGTAYSLDSPSPLFPLGTDNSVAYIYNGSNTLATIIYGASNSSATQVVPATAGIGNNYHVGRNIANSAVVHDGVLYRVLTIGRALTTTEATKVNQWLRGTA